MTICNPIGFTGAVALSEKNGRTGKLSTWKFARPALYRKYQKALFSFYP